MDFIESVKEKAKNNKKTIILPEGMDLSLIHILIPIILAG